MEVVYYRDHATRITPVKYYLSQYAISESDTTKNKDWKKMILAKIDQKIIFLQNANGRPIAPVATPLHGYSFFEIKARKDRNILIRVVYFCFEGKMVLLHAFEKPSNYNTNREKKAVTKEYDIADEYKDRFINNPTHYDKYQQKEFI